MLLHTVRVTGRILVFFLCYYSSQCNHEECELVVELVKVLINSGQVPTKIGIITPYKRQTSLIREQLNKRYITP